MRNFKVILLALFIAALAHWPDARAADTRSPTYAPFLTVRNAYVSVNVTTGAWVQLVASTAREATAIEIFDSSGQTLKLGVGGSGSEVTLVTVFPGGNGFIPVDIPQGSRVSIRAITGTANTGELDLDLMQ